MRDNQYNIQLQNSYDELITGSKDVWAESAAGGFASKKRANETSTDGKAFMKSPEKSKESKKDAAIGSVKKTTVKLHAMQPKDPSGSIAVQLQ